MSMVVASGWALTIIQADYCSIDQKYFLAPEVAKRLACDASLTTLPEDDQGKTLNIGRRSRIGRRLSLSRLHPNPLHRQSSHQALGRGW
jgi:hypothetical protein